MPQVPYFATGFDDCMAGRRGRKTFDVSVNLWRTREEADAAVAGKVIDVFEYYAPSEEVLEKWISDHKLRKECHAESLKGY